VSFAVNVPALLAIRTYAEKTGLALPAHPHMLQHACGFALADQGADTRLIQDYWTSKHSAYCQIYS